MAIGRGVRDWLAIEWRRTSGGLAGRPALCVGRSGAELSGAEPDSSSDLGRSGAAVNPERQDSTLVECDTGPGPLGGSKSALRQALACGIGCGSGASSPCVGTIVPACRAVARQTDRSLAGGGRCEDRSRACDASRAIRDGI